jgi:aminoglycoside phosphotransferase (APT) family kinase protein
VTRDASALVLEVLGQFDLGGAVEGVEVVVEGHINRSWVATARSAGGPAARFFLQRINEAVFRAPEQVMDNVERVTRHLTAALAREGAPEPARRALRLVPTRAEAPFHRDGDGGVWRVYPYIEGTRVREHVTTREEAREVGRAFGTFQKLLAGYDGPRLHETIPHFHDAAGRLEALEAALAADRAGRADGARTEIEAALARRAMARILPPLLAGGAVPERIAHNDAKSSNVLLDAASGEALCVVDLDTVMPGTLLSDFGDMVRSATSPTAEDESDLGAVGAEPALFAGLAEGYLAAAGPILTPTEKDLLVVAGQLITWEQAVRFLTDHLDGDRYYRVDRAGHNLARARTQLALLESLERQADEFGEMIQVMGDEC